MDIIRTIQATEDPSRVESYFNGQMRSLYFPLRGTPSKACKDDWLYVIFRGKVVGRCRIDRIQTFQKPTPIAVGSDGHVIDARCLVHVQVPGQRVPHEKKPIDARGWVGFRYVPESLW